MSENMVVKSGDGNLLERFSIDARLVGVMSLIAFLGILLVGFTIILGETLSAFRSYATMQTHWTEIRKEAVNNLEIYTLIGSPEYLVDYKSHVHMLEDIDSVRQELESANIDMDRVVSKMQPLRFSDRQIRNMAEMYGWLDWFREMQQALDIWRASDLQIAKLDSLASHIQAANDLPNTPPKRWVDEINAIDNSITRKQYQLGSVLDQGTERLRNMIFWSTAGVGLILFLFGIILSRRFLKSIRKWEESLKVNFQKYRSLFDENPNAVFAFDLDGRFLQGNKSLKNILSISDKELKDTTFDEFIHESERKKVRAKFEKAAAGIPQTYETIGVDREGRTFHVEVTNLPINVDDNIVGVYGLAQNINERIEAERQVQDQLKEKNVLLEEIHHRVKNNLAFVSGLLNLQEDFIDAKNAKDKLIEAQNRIVAVADIHEIFYDTEKLSELQVPKYAEKIFSRLFNTFEPKETKITYIIDATDIQLPVNQAIPFGLILNELITNSCKHAFKGLDEGAITLGVEKSNGKVKVVYRDSGSGLPEDFKIESAAASSLGMQLIHTFMHQLDAQYQLATGSDHFQLEFSFDA